jgi:hypothetical protein
MWERRGTYGVLVGKPERRRPFEKPRCRLENNIKMDLREVGWGYGRDRSGSGYGQMADSCECDKETFGFLKLRGISFLDEVLLASQKGFSSMELVIHVIKRSDRGPRVGYPWSKRYS